MLFTGYHEHTIDAKRRLAIPSDIRNRWDAKVHGTSWYAVPWVGNVIRLYTETAFQNSARAYSSSLTPDEDEAELYTTLFGLSVRLEMDVAGRIRLPEELLELTNLAQNVALIGAGEWLEIQDRDAWRASIPEKLKKLPELMKRVEQKNQQRRAGGG